MSVVRPSETRPGKIELPNPSRMTKVICMQCKAVNNFSDDELLDIEAKIVGQPDVPPKRH
jgi:Fe2+ or Zn2+ uptake regulation protein